MLAENQNKTLSEKLQNLDQIPDGFDFSSDAVWLELESKLLQQKKPSGILYYAKYLAAASIILAISITALILIRKQVPTTQTTIASKEKPVLIKVEPREILDAKIQPAKKELHNYAPTKNSEIISSVANAIVAEPILVVAEPNQHLQQQPISETLAISTNTAIATAVEKKKPIVAKRLPIIHINEISPAAEPVYSKTNNKYIYLNETEDVPLNPEHPKPWWQPKPKPVNPIISLTDNQ